MEKRRNKAQEEIIPDLEKIHAAGKLFLARLNNIIDFAKIDAGLKSPAPGAPDQSPLIDSVMASLRELARESAAAYRR